MKPSAEEGRGEMEDQPPELEIVATKQPMNLAALVVLGLIGGSVGTVLLLFVIGLMN